MQFAATNEKDFGILSATTIAKGAEMKTLVTYTYPSTRAPQDNEPASGWKLKRCDRHCDGPEEAVHNHVPFRGSEMLRDG
jgi:hypothetical protein